MEVSFKDKSFEELTFEDINRLDYLDCFLKEIMRLYGRGTRSIPVDAMCDTSISEFKVEKNTVVMAYQGSLQRSERYWENAEKFDPSRWEKDENG